MPRPPRPKAAKPAEKPVRLRKREELTELLRRRIATMPNGQRMPSVRGLMKRYHLSMQTVTAALQQLETEKLIVSRPGSGTYVSDEHDRKLIVLHRTYHPSYYEDFREHALRDAITKVGWLLVTRRHDITPDQHPALLPEPAASAHLVSQDLGNLRRDLMNDLLSQKVPIITLERAVNHCPLLDSILRDDDQHEATIMGHLASLGHRKVGAVLNEPHLIQERAADDIHRDVLKKFGVDVTLIDCKTKPGESSSEMAYYVMKKFIAEHRNKLPFSAVCVISSPGAIGVLRALHESGIKVPQQCSVISFGYELINALLVPSLTEVGVPYEAWGEAAVEVLKKRFSFHDPAPLLVKLPARVVSRESTAPHSSKSRHSKKKRR